MPHDEVAVTRAGALVLVLVASGTAAADRPNLRLTHEPPPRHLRMRPRTAAAAKPEPAATKSEAKPPDALAVDAPATTDPLLELGSIRDVRRPVSLRVNLGYVVDGTALTGKPNLSEREVRDFDVARIRAYAIGEGYFSTRGVIAPSLSTYFATRFQIARPTRTFDPSDPNQTRATVGPPIATWFERSGLEPRAVWIEAKDFLPDPRLAPLRVRAGELYVYGPWMLHMYGVNSEWDGKLVRAQLYAGSRVPDYTLAGFFDNKDRAGIGGGALRFDLRALKRPIPFAIGVEGLAFSATGADDSKATRHGMLQVDWRPRRDIALIGQVRALEGELANEHVQLRSRYKQATNLVFDFTHRHRSDWRWDPSVTNPDPLQARRYLDLGPVVPQALISGRAGTLIKENVDLYVRGAYSFDMVEEGEARISYSAPSVELGGALEVRLRRTIGLGLSGLTRQTQRTARVSAEIADIPDQIDPLPAQYSSELGERGFTELGTTLRLSLGARRLSALVEVYGRRTRYSLVYCDGADTPSCQDAVDTGILTQDIRGGGRVSIDAWIGSQLRLFASYELSSQLDFQREISGFKSLRLTMEGIY
jgi:hypothetical protein